MNEIDLTRIASMTFTTNRVYLNGVGITDKHPEHDYDWFTLDVSVLDGEDLLM